MRNFYFFLLGGKEKKCVEKGKACIIQGAVRVFHFLKLSQQPNKTLMSTFPCMEIDSNRNPKR